MPRKLIGCIHRGQVGKGWSPREETDWYDIEDKSCNAGDQNTTSSYVSNSRLNQPKKTGYLLSSELDYPR